MSIVRTEEVKERLLAIKGGFHNFVTSLCTSEKKGTGAECSCEPQSIPRNQMYSRKCSELGSVFTSNPMLMAAQASMAIRSGSDSTEAATPEGSALPNLHPQRTIDHLPMLLSTSDPLAKP